MPRRRLPYQPGTWFAVPLRDDGFAAGRVARVDGRGRLLGYFFGPRRAMPPSCAEVAELRPRDATLIMMLGHLGLLSGRWPIICVDADPDLVGWPVPKFFHKDALLPDLWFARSYGETLELVGERRISEAEAVRLPEDGLAGPGLVEIRLTKLLIGTM
ncbi:MAG: Imm26 family immunity protein [Chloroflexota bacterium]